jgi:hypothetical protein
MKLLAAVFFRQLRVVDRADPFAEFSVQHCLDFRGPERLGLYFVPLFSHFSPRFAPGNPAHADLIMDGGGKRMRYQGWIYSSTPASFLIW